jgi:mannose-6-phosphate isomerase-like protein (cupin superfamily)
MKRNSFLRVLITASTFLTVPLYSSAKRLFKTRDNKGFKVDSGNDRFGKSISLFEGDTFFTKVSTKDSDGDMYAFESTRVKKGGPTLHYHYDQDEWWYILEGEFLFKVGDKMFNTKAGDSVFGPRGVPHTFAKTNDGDAKMLIIFQPAGKMEACFQAISEGKLSKMTQEQQDDFRKMHGFERVGGPLTYFKNF